MTGSETGAFFGESTSLDALGNILAIGAKGVNMESGQAKVFQFNGMDWIQMGADINGEVAYDKNGISLALSSAGNRLIVGATYHDASSDSTGYARVFEWDGMNWNQLGSNIDGEMPNELAGIRVTISYDGNRIGVSSPFHSSVFSFAGRVRIFDFNGTDWVQVGENIDGEHTFETLGASISFSANNMRFAVGADFNNEAGDQAGQARVYEFIDPNPVPTLSSWTFMTLLLLFLIVGRLLAFPVSSVGRDI